MDTIARICSPDSIVESENSRTQPPRPLSLLERRHRRRCQHPWLHHLLLNNDLVSPKDTPQSPTEPSVAEAKTPNNDARDDISEEMGERTIITSSFWLCDTDKRREEEVVEYTLISQRSGSQETQSCLRLPNDQSSDAIDQTAHATDSNRQEETVQDELVRAARTNDDADLALSFVKILSSRIARSCISDDVKLDYSSLYPRTRWTPNDVKLEKSETVKLDESTVNSIDDDDEQDIEHPTKLASAHRDSLSLINNDSDKFSYGIAEQLVQQASFDFYRDGKNMFRARTSVYNQLIEKVVSQKYISNAFIAGGFFTNYIAEYCNDLNEEFRAAHEWTKCADIFVPLLNTFSPSWAQMNSVLAEPFRFSRASYIRPEIMRGVYTSLEMGKVTIGSETFRVCVRVCDDTCENMLSKFLFKPSKIAFKYNTTEIVAAEWFRSGGELFEKGATCDNNLVEKYKRRNLTHTEPIDGRVISFLFAKMTLPF